MISSARLRELLAEAGLRTVMVQLKDGTRIDLHPNRADTVGDTLLILHEWETGDSLSAEAT